ncbi:nucleotidyltransferase domain-containing protein [Candidatus Woesearchaeota archaeon]|nr:nucleotidyltransferase domain-containing protein [Candidatus Woesearchaeota archaeon]
MQIQKLAVKEQLVKNVVKSGNGGAVWVPKDWLGQEVVVILPDKPKLSPRRRVLRILEPYLKDVIAVFIYGSYARHEETEESDIDVMVITKESQVQLKIDEPNIEVTAFQLDNLKRAIQKYPVVYCQIVQEAEPLINSDILNELKNIKIDKEDFKYYINETKEHIKSNKELLELDRLDNVYVKSYSAVYSTMLRLRGIFIVKCILSKEKFSNKSFQEWLIKKGMTNKEFEQCYAVYRLIRGNKTVKNIKIKISTAEKLLNAIIKETESIESKVHG